MNDTVDFNLFDIIVKYWKYDDYFTDVTFCVTPILRNNRSVMTNLVGLGLVLKCDWTIKALLLFAISTRQFALQVFVIFAVTFLVLVR